MTKEERAEISRRNGAKSKGPVTPEGKEKSARNSIDHGRRAGKLAHFAPPHYAALCNEDRAEYYQLLDDLLLVFKPKNTVAASIVRDIAVARWQILRLETLITNQWNFALIDQAQKPLTVAPELGELQAMARATELLYNGNAIVSKLNRDIDRLQSRIIRLERSLRAIHAHYQESPQRTQPELPKQAENSESEAKNEQPFLITEDTPEVRAFYHQLDPNRKIVVLPRDHVANGVEIDDTMPDLPRKAA